MNILSQEQVTKLNSHGCLNVVENTSSLALITLQLPRGTTHMRWTLSVDKSDDGRFNYLDENCELHIIDTIEEVVEIIYS